MPDTPGGGFELGSAFVTVDPNADTFEDKLRAEVEDTNLIVTIPVEPDTEGFQARVDKAVKDSAATITVPVEPDTAGLKAKVDAAADEAHATVTVPLEPDSEGFREKVESEVGDTGAKSVVPLEPESAGFAEKAAAEGEAAGAESGTRFGEKFSSVAGNAPLFAGAAEKTEHAAEEAGDESGSRFGERFKSLLSGMPLFNAGGVEREAEGAAEESGVGFGERFKSKLAGIPLLAGALPGLIGEAGEDGEKAGKSLSERMAAVLSGADLLEVLIPAGLIAGVALLGTKFQSAMEMIVTQAGVARKSLHGLEGGVLDLAGQVGFSPDSLAGALYHIESSFQSVGIKGPEALNLLRIAAEGARVGNANLVDVTNALDAVIVSGITGVHSYGQAMGVLNAIVGSGDMTMQDLAAAMGTGLMAAAKSYGQSIYQVGAALAVFGDNNIRGAKAATDLRMAMQAILDPVSTAADALHHLGLTSKTLGDTMEHHGLTAAIGELITHLRDSHVPIGEWGQYVTDIFGKKAGVGVSVLMDQFRRLEGKFPDLEHGAHRFGSAWQETQHTVSQQLHDLEGDFLALGTKIGMAILPSMARILGSMVNGLKGAEKFGSGLWNVVGGPVKAVYDGINKISDAFNGMLLKIGKEAFDKLRDFFKNLDLAKSVKREFGDIDSFLSGISFLRPVEHAFDEVKSYISHAFGDLFSHGKGGGGSGGLFGALFGDLDGRWGAARICFGLPRFC